MPSSMIHLLTAFKYNPKASVEFWIGNIAPDSVSDWKEKDKTHFRDKPNRIEALRDLAGMMNLEDDFNKGILLHLYLDYCWDSYPMSDYIKNFKDGNWFQFYRDEIALAGSWLFHHTEWAKTVWDKMVVCPMSVHENVFGIIKEDLDDFIMRNNKWHIENNIGPSAVFTPDFIEKFTNKVTIEFTDWLENMA